MSSFCIKRLLIIWLPFFYVLLYPNVQHKFAIIVPSYNNALWYKKNLDSIFSQTYKNYRVIYIDDCSTDKTGLLVERYVRIKGKQSIVTLIKNGKRKGHMANHYTAAHLCQDDEIIVHLDGDDWFAHDKVLEKLNTIYQNPNIWLTYGQYSFLSNNKPGHCRLFPAHVLTQRSFRTHPFVSSHLRTFYARLFKQIKLEDFMHQGVFIPLSVDIAIMMPLLELAGNHIAFIPEVLYIYNDRNPLSFHATKKVLQQQVERIIRTKKKYPLFLPTEQKKKPQIKVVLLLNQGPMGPLIQAIKQNIKGNYSLQVICTCRSLELVKEKYLLRTSMPEFHPDYCTIYTPLYKNLLLELINPLAYDYLLLLDNSVCLNRPIDLAHYTAALQQTHAFAFYINLHALKTDSRSVPLNDNIHAWQFGFGHGEEKNQSFNLTLYSAAEFFAVLQKVNARSYTELKQQWHIAIDPQKVGLYQRSSS